MISLLIGGVLHSSPDAAVLLLTVGLLLVCVELNRPGWIVPGGVGLLLLLFAVASLLRLDLSLAGAALLATAAALLLLDLLRPTPPIVAPSAAACCWGWRAQCSPASRAAPAPTKR
jgi:membrane-bound ClpP family serine protease